MNDMTAIRLGLGANLFNVFGNDGYEVQAFARSAPVPPGFQIMPSLITFHGTLQSGMEVRQFIVIGTVGFADDIDSQDQLDVLLSDQDNISDPLSVRQALESDQALTSRLINGAVVTGQPSAADDVTVTQDSGYKLYGLQGGNQVVLGAEWTVEVRT